MVLELLLGVVFERSQIDPVDKILDSIRDKHEALNTCRTAYLLYEHMALSISIDRSTLRS